MDTAGFEAVYNAEVNKKNEDLMSTEYFEKSVKSLVDMSRDKIKICRFAHSREGVNY